VGEIDACTVVGQREVVELRAGGAEDLLRSGEVAPRGEQSPADAAQPCDGGAVPAGAGEVL
jgi:hypothetical protein